MPATGYRSAEGEAHIGALYDEALAALGADYESVTVGTRLGDTHVIAVGPEGSPPALFLPGGNFLNPTRLRWFLPLAQEHRLCASDLVGQPVFSAGETLAFRGRPRLRGGGRARRPRPRTRARPW